MRTSFIERAIDFVQRKINIKRYWIKKGLVIGHDCEIYQSAVFGSEPYLVRLGNHVRINRDVEFVTHDGGVWVLRHLAGQNTGIDDKVKKADLFGPIVVGDNVHIGTRAIIMPNVTIGNNCIIGCGAIVTKDIPDNSIAVGIPARVIETIDDYYKKHLADFDFIKGLSTKNKTDYLIRKFQK